MYMTVGRRQLPQGSSTYSLTAVSDLSDCPSYKQAAGSKASGSKAKASPLSLGDPRASSAPPPGYEEGFMEMEVELEPGVKVMVGVRERPPFPSQPEG